ERRCVERRARYLRGPRSAGAKRNVAGAAATEEILLFVDSDCIAQRSTIEEHLRVLRQAPADVAGVAGATRMTGRPKDSWGVLEYCQRYNTCFDFAELYQRVAWATTSNLSVRRPVFESVGGFDEATFTLAGGEDVDLGIRVTERGYRWVTNARS